MAITFLRSSSTDTYSNTNTVASPATEAAAGNLIVVYITSSDELHDGAPTVTDTAGNTYTLMAYRSGTPGVSMVAYTFATAGHASNVVTALWDESLNNRHGIIVHVYSKDAGDTWSIDQSATGGATYGTAVSTANITTTGTDEVCCAFEQSKTTHTVSSAEIAAGAATELEDITTSASWYRIFTSTQTDINATATGSGDCWWFCDLVSFKATAGAGGIPIPILTDRDKRRRIIQL